MTHQDDSFAHLFTGTAIEREERPRAPHRRQRAAWSRVLSILFGRLLRRVPHGRRR